MSNQSRTTPVAKYDSEHGETGASYQHILYEVSDKVATITLNRPDRMNAWTPIMERDVRHAMESAAADDSVPTARKIVGKTKAGSHVTILGRFPSCWRCAIHSRIDKAQTLEVEVGNTILSLDIRREDIIPNAEI